ncbi:MAG: HDOD domain-containing protein [Desulfatiglans sp.]|jgi:putative nucleotidyltransferase with HDIG domain|nr:HDOD domain-containing protein [Thermodesulfobacteriota bacterium]MEE4351877.1 HDOD domain-containing protein [Desulfatiglans sp.]
MEKAKLRAKIYSRIDELPTLPAILPKLLSIMEDEKTNASHVADAISHDPAMTSKILKIANSAYYGFQQEICDLSKAVALLGFNMVRSLALSIGVIETMPSSKKSLAFSSEGLWIHSLAVATAAQELSKRFGKGDGDTHHFVVGLLHDIGKIVLYQFFHDLFLESLEEAHSKENMGLFEAERRVIGLDHGYVGSMLLTRWKFPEVIHHAIAAHHEEGVPEGPGAHDVAILRIADALTQELRLGDAGNPSAPEVRPRDLGVLGLKKGSLEQVTSYLKGTEEGIYAFFEAMR